MHNIFFLHGSTWAKHALPIEREPELTVEMIKCSKALTASLRKSQSVRRNCIQSKLSERSGQLYFNTAALAKPRLNYSSYKLCIFALPYAASSSLLIRKRFLLPEGVLNHPKSRNRQIMAKVLNRNIRWYFLHYFHSVYYFEYIEHPNKRSTVFC